MVTSFPINRHDLDRSGEVQDRLQQLWECPVSFGSLWHGGVLEPDGTRRKQYSPVHYEIAELAKQHQFLSVVISRNHGKTTECADLALHDKWRNINDSIMYCSAGTSLAAAILGDIKGTMLSERDLPIIPGDLEVPFRVAFPELMPTRAPSGSPAGSFNVAGRSAGGKEPCFFPRSPRSAKAGLHPHRIYVDDVANENNSNNPSTRESVIDFMRQLVPILHSQTTGVIRHIGTPWAFYDVSAWLAENPAFHQVRYGCWDGVNPLTGEQDGEGPGPNGGWPLAPSYMTAEELYAQQRQIDDEEFWSYQYLVKPVAASNAIFTKELLDPRTVDKIPEGGSTILLWDPTSRADPKTGDWNGIIVVRAIPAQELKGQVGYEGFADLVAQAPDANVFVPIHAHEQQGPPGDCMSVIEELHERYKLDAIWVEDTGASGALLPWFHEKHWVRRDRVRLRAVKISSKAKKAQRLQGVQVGIKEGRVIFPRDYPGASILRQRLMEFPKSQSDDLPDALALLTNSIMRRGQIILAEQEEVCYDPRSVNFQPPNPGKKRNHRW